MIERREAQRDARELPGPEASIGVVERRLQLDRVGRGVDGVVDEPQRTVGRLRISVLRRGDDRKRAVRHRALDGRQVHRRYGERDVHRLDLGDRHQLGRVRGDEIAALDREVARPAVDG